MQINESCWIWNIWKRLFDIHRKWSWRESSFWNSNSNIRNEFFSRLFENPMAEKPEKIHEIAKPMEKLTESWKRAKLKVNLSMYPMKIFFRVSSLIFSETKRYIAFAYWKYSHFRDCQFDFGEQWCLLSQHVCVFKFRLLAVNLDEWQDEPRLFQIWDCSPVTFTLATYFNTKWN